MTRGRGQAKTRGGAAILAALAHLSRNWVRIGAKVAAAAWPTLRPTSGFCSLDGVVMFAIGGGKNFQSGQGGNGKKDGLDDDGQEKTHMLYVFLSWISYFLTACVLYGIATAWVFWNSVLDDATVLVTGHSIFSYLNNALSFVSFIAVLLFATISTYIERHFFMKGVWRKSGGMREALKKAVFRKFLGIVFIALIIVHGIKRVDEAWEEFHQGVVESFKNFEESEDEH